MVAGSAGYRASFELRLPSWCIVSYREPYDDL